MSSLDVAIELNGWRKIFSGKKSECQFINTYHLFPLGTLGPLCQVGEPPRLPSPVGPDSQPSYLFPNQTLCSFLKFSHSTHLICKYIDRLLNSLVVTRHESSVSVLMTWWYKLQSCRHLGNTILDTLLKYLQLEFL